MTHKLFKKYLDYLELELGSNCLVKISQSGAVATLISQHSFSKSGNFTEVCSLPNKLVVVRLSKKDYFNELITEGFFTKPLINKNLLKKAIKKWGRDVQIQKIQEELIELALAINRLNSPIKNKEDMVQNLYDELGDVKIMMAQAEIIFDKKRINKRVDFKLNKMAEKYFNDK